MSGPPIGQPPGPGPGTPPLNQPGYQGGPGYPPGYPPPQPNYGGEGAKPITIGNQTYILASYLDRALAWLIDQFILSVPMVAVVFFVQIVMAVLIAAIGAGGRNQPSPALAVLMVLMFLMIFAAAFGVTIWYWCFFITREMWSTGPGQTLGCKVMKIRIIKQDGSMIRPMDAFLRFLGVMVSGMVFYLGFLWIVIDERNLGWHDSIASTYVIKS